MKHKWREIDRIRNYKFYICNRCGKNITLFHMRGVGNGTPDSIRSIREYIMKNPQEQDCDIEIIKQVTEL